MVVIVFDDDQVLFGDHQILAVDLAEDVRAQYFLRRTGGIQPGLQQHQPVDAFADHVDVVGHEENGQTHIAMQPLNQIEHAVLRRDIDAGGRFVEQEHLRLLRQRPRDEDPLLLPAGKMPQGRLPVIVHRHAFQRVHGNIAILFRRPPEESQHPVAPHHDRLEHGDGEIAVQGFLLRKIPDAGAVVAVQLFAGTVEYFQAARERRHEAEDRAAERRFTRSVRPDDADKLTFRDVQRDVLQRHHAGETERRMGKSDDRVVHKSLKVRKS